MKYYHAERGAANDALFLLKFDMCGWRSSEAGREGRTSGKAACFAASERIETVIIASCLSFVDDCRNDKLTES